MGENLTSLDGSELKIRLQAYLAMEIFLGLVRDNKSHFEETNFRFLWASWSGTRKLELVEDIRAFNLGYSDEIPFNFLRKDNLNLG
jgi:hypothetical protein